jgi:Tripartite tricarboxylate transporter family receptor
MHVPYRGAAGPALVDLLGGQVQVMFPTMSASIGYIRTSKLRALAVTTPTRSEALPQVSTVSDFVPGFEATFWTGIGAPKNMPADIVDKLNREINAGLADPKADIGQNLMSRSEARLALPECQSERLRCLLLTSGAGMRPRRILGEENHAQDGIGFPNGSLRRCPLVHFSDLGRCPT